MFTCGFFIIIIILIIIIIIIHTWVPLRKLLERESKLAAEEGTKNLMMQQADNIVKTGTTHNKSKLATKWLVQSVQLRNHLWFLTFKLGLNCPYSRISLE